MATWGSNFNPGVAQYTIGADGSLAPMAAPSVASEAGPMFVTVDPSGKYVYVANFFGSVSQYKIGADGSLTANVPSTVAAGSNPQSIITTGTWQ